MQGRAEEVTTFELPKVSQEIQHMESSRSYSDSSTDDADSINAPRRLSLLFGLRVDWE